MFFSRQMSTGNVIALCRAMRHSLGAGLALVQVFRQQADRGPPGVRPLAERVLTELEQGHGLSDALEMEKQVLPSLMLSMAKLGEETGHLAEIFGELEKYFVLQDATRKQLRSQAMSPVIQLCMAFVILATLIFILGMISAGNPGAPIKGVFGFRGATGAVLFLLVSFGSVGLLWFMGKTAMRLARQKPRLDSLLLHLPVVGPCLEGLAMGRFTMALHLTLDSGMPIVRALQLSLKATGSPAYMIHSFTITQALKNGTSLLEALTRTNRFSDDFLSLVAVGEEGGRVPEVMRQQSIFWHEEVAHRFKIATRLAGMLVWLVYAGFMIAAIFNVAGVYFRGLGF